MKNIVINDQYDQLDLKPSQLIERYISLTQRDVGKILADPAQLSVCHCPACGATEKQQAFVKFSLTYQECQHCRTLYVSPRPNDTMLNDYYLKSDARAFWCNELSQLTDKKRKEKVIKPRFQWILESTREYFPNAKTWVDINTSQYSYIDAMADADIFENKILLNPYLPLEPQDYPRVAIVKKPWWEEPAIDQVSVISLFEVIDHTADVGRLMATVNAMLSKGGLCFLTAILSSGFDIQTLWEQAENLHPPDRLNCFSVKGLHALFEKYGFECLELSTPGIFDLEFVAKKLKEQPCLNVPRFVRDLIERKDEETKRAFQEFLQSACMSSYGRILIRKKG
ncbi:MAG: methyltransferase domain-containing protein [Candidatus Omnitrophica bacterium]|nr:methyltransferase domain-containing protein [Candidatus Omnitrophota bacterium]